jgi:hypothetical protein
VLVATIASLIVVLATEVLLTMAAGVEEAEKSSAYETEKGIKSMPIERTVATTPDIGLIFFILY